LGASRPPARCGDCGLGFSHKIGFLTLFIVGQKVHGVLPKLRDIGECFLRIAAVEERDVTVEMFEIQGTFHHVFDHDLWHPVVVARGEESFDYRIAFAAGDDDFLALVRPRFCRISVLIALGKQPKFFDHLDGEIVA
jgi:hypothetical protein